MNLDLIYEEIDLQTTQIKKINEKETHYDCLVINENGDTYNTIGHKIKTDDLSSTKINAWKFNGLKRTNVYKAVETIFI